MVEFGLPSAGVCVRRPAVEAELYARLRDRAQSTNLLVVTGSRGSGKTSLLRSLASQWPEKDGPVTLARLEPISCSPEVLGSELVRLGGDSLAYPAAAGLRQDAASAFDALLRALRGRTSKAVFLLDDLTEVQSLSYYPGVEEPLDHFVLALAEPSGSSVVATTRFGYRFSRAFPQIPRYELPPWSIEEAERLGCRDAPQLIAASGGVPAYFLPLARRRERTDSPFEALSLEMASGGTVEAECRATLQELLHRARG